MAVEADGLAPDGSYFIAAVEHVVRIDAGVLPDVAAEADLPPVRIGAAAQQSLGAFFLGPAMHLMAGLAPDLAFI